MLSRFTISIAALMIAATAFAHDPAQTDGDKYKVIFENERVRVLEYKDRPGDKTQPASPPGLRAVRHGALQAAHTCFPTARLSMREFKAGDVLYSEAQTHIGENVGNTPTHVIMVEMK